MNKYINTRPLFEKICNLEYAYTIRHRIKKLDIDNYRVFETKTNGRSKVNYCMSIEDWNRVKETLEEV